MKARGQKLGKVGPVCHGAALNFLTLNFLTGKKSKKVKLSIKNCIKNTKNIVLKTSSVKKYKKTVLKNSENIVLKNVIVTKF